MTRTARLVLASGGLDSAVLIAWARRQGAVSAFTLDFPDRPRGERAALDRILAHYQVRSRFEISLPDDGNPWLRGRPGRGFLPGRNLVLHATAAAVARHAGIRTLVAGHSGPDAKAFPDARRSFLRAVERSINVDVPASRRLRIETPFATWTKRDIVGLGRRLAVPFELTWSCYLEGPRPCGRCVACRERAHALAQS